MIDKETNQHISYIGYTERSLNKKIPEHKRDIENNTSYTALAQRAQISNLKINWNNARIVRKENDPKRRRIAEVLTIFEKKKSDNKLINKIDPSAISNAWRCCVSCQFF